MKTFLPSAVPSRFFVCLCHFFDSLTHSELIFFFKKKTENVNETCYFKLPEEIKSGLKMKMKMMVRVALRGFDCAIKYLIFRLIFISPFIKLVVIAVIMQFAEKCGYNVATI